MTTISFKEVQDLYKNNPYFKKYDYSYDKEIYERALDLVINESPASNEDRQLYLAARLTHIAIEENEDIARAWIMNEYWDKYK